MKKSDLRSGMVVRVRNGFEYLVMIPDSTDYDTLFLMNKNGHTWLNCGFGEDLLDQKGDDGFDVMAVYDIRRSGFSSVFENLENRLLWKREEPLKVTMEEIYEKFGCKVKIVEG